MALQQLIIERIKHAGPITFAEYMRMALYEPGYGYYVTGAAKMGWEGDYYTSTDVSNFFAHCMGRQLYQMWQELNQPAPFRVLEQGAGRGHLGAEVLSWAAQKQPDLYASLNYQNEDIRVGYDALTASDNSWPTQDADKYSVVLSNELVDAFPVHIVQLHNKHLYEVFVDVHDGRLREVLDVPSAPEVAAYLDRYKIPWRDFSEGWRAEINLNALHWIEHTAHILHRTSNRRKPHGFILTIDYGEKARALYTRYRQHGTLACYFQHQLTERPLLRPGEQDITAHVNFSALIDAGRQQGLHLHAYTTQRLWLEGMGIYDELERLRTREYALADSERATDRGQIALLQWYNQRQRVSALTDPHGMGNFKVLIMKC